MIRTEMTTDSSRAECRFKKVLAVREKRLLQTAAPAHIVPNQLYFRFTQAKKNKQTKKLKVIYSKSARTYLKHCFSLSVPLWLFHCAVKSHGVQKYSYSAFFFANCIVSSNKYENGFLQATILENTARFTAYPNPHMKSPSNTQNWWI